MIMMMLSSSSSSMMMVMMMTGWKEGPKLIFGAVIRSCLRDVTCDIKACACHTLLIPKPKAKETPKKGNSLSLEALLAIPKAKAKETPKKGISLGGARGDAKGKAGGKAEGGAKARGGAKVAWGTVRSEGGGPKEVKSKVVKAKVSKNKSGGRARNRPGADEKRRKLL